MSHAVVIGSSIAGMAAAAVLSQRFDQVTVLERDTLDDEGGFRRGVPQARHVHALLASGQRELIRLFPGVYERWLAAGGQIINLGSQTDWYAFGGYRPHYTSALDSVCLSRPRIEGAVRDCLRTNPRVQIRDGVGWAGLVVEAGRVTGITLDGGEVVTADLVVDASGRGSRTPTFLAELGYPVPTESVVTSKAGYATRIISLPAGHPLRRFCYIQPTPPAGTRGAVIVPMEGDRYHLTLIGMAGDVPPTDDAGFQAFADSLPAPEIAAALRASTALSPTWSFHRAENRLRHYDALTRRPEGLLVMGDAVLAFNPVYGQGMSVAALSAGVLERALDAQTRRGAVQIPGLAARFQKDLARLLAFPYQIATGEDRRWPLAENAGTLDLPTRLLQRYVDALMRASLQSPVATEALYRVMHMVDSPAGLFRPGVVFQVLRCGLRSWLARPAGGLYESGRYLSHDPDPLAAIPGGAGPGR